MAYNRIDVVAEDSTVLGKMLESLDANVTNDFGVPNQKTECVDVDRPIIFSVRDDEVRFETVVINRDFSRGHGPRISKNGSIIYTRYFAQAPIGILPENGVEKIDKSN